MDGCNKEYLEVGDKVLIESPYGKHVVTITRVTKTKAIAGGTAFKRKISPIFGIERWSPIRFDMCKRTLVSN